MGKFFLNFFPPIVYVPNDQCVMGRPQRLKHAAACRSTYFWGLFVGILKHTTAHCHLHLASFGLQFVGTHANT